MITLHHAPFSRSVRVRWLLEELELPHRLVVLPSATAVDPFSQATPTGKVPTLEDGGLVMFESIAILEYLVECHGGGRLAPERGTPAWGRWLQWMHYAEATAFPPIGYLARHTMALPPEARIPASAEENRRLAVQVLAPAEQALGTSEHLAGQAFSAADVAFGYTVGVAKLMGLLEGLPRLDAYFARLARRPAFQRATTDGPADAGDGSADAAGAGGG